jgi:DNA polymerase-3 subunit beta
MNFVINRKALEVELSALQIVAERKSIIPVLSTVRMIVADGMAQLTATDLDMSLLTQVPAAGESWSGCVPAKQLHELMRLLQGEQVEFEPKDNERIQVKNGRSKHLLPTLPVSQFPQLEQPQPEMVTTDGAVLRTAIERATACTSINGTQMWMHGVAFRSHEGQLYIVASNNPKTAVSVITSPLNVDLLLHVNAATALTKLLSDADVQLGANTNQLILTQDGRSFISRLLDAKFPDWRPLIPASFQHTVILDPEPARQAFRLASVTAKEMALIPIPLRLTIAKDELTVETAESERGHSSETLAIDCATLNGEKLTRGVNGAHFINFLDSDAKTLMSFNDDLRLVQLSYEGEPDYRYITMTLKA